jgi:Fur family transcriptional regulator, peroxide stress response regulator
MGWERAILVFRIDSCLSALTMTDGNKIKQRILDALRSRGIKLTAQRMEIIDILVNEVNHPSARTLFTKVRRRMPHVSTSTVYYTLGLLKKEGLIKELQFYDMENRYESQMTDHIDLICEKCGTIGNYERDLSGIPTVIENETGFKARRLRYEYYGICKKCGHKKE